MKPRVAVILLWATILSAARGEDPLAGLNPARPFRPGDLVIMEFPRTLGAITDVVDEHGDIVLPFIGKIRIGGATPDEAATIITDRYVPDFWRTLSVFVRHAKVRWKLYIDEKGFLRAVPPASPKWKEIPPRPRRGILPPGDYGPPPKKRPQHRDITIVSI